MLLLKEELKKLELEKAHLQDEIVKERQSAARQLADAEADANHVVRELRRVVGELDGQLKQQVGATVVLISVVSLRCGVVTLLYRKLKC